MINRKVLLLDKIEDWWKKIIMSAIEFKWVNSEQTI